MRFFRGASGAGRRSSRSSRLHEGEEGELQHRDHGEAVGVQDLSAKKGVQDLKQSA